MSNTIYTKWYPRYYYILENNITKKLYLGQTTNEPGINYFGSGVHWINHCKKYGGHNKNGVNCVWKKWFIEKQDAEDFIVKFENENQDYWKNDNTQWLNMIQESTENNPFFGASEYQKQRIKDGTHPFANKETFKKRWTEEHKKRQSIISTEQNKIVWNSRTQEEKNEIFKKIGISNTGKKSKRKGIERTIEEKNSVSKGTIEAMKDKSLRDHLSKKAIARCDEAFRKRTSEMNKRRVCCIKCGYETGLSSLPSHQRGKKCLSIH